MVPLAWLVLTKICFPFKADMVRGGQDVVQAELAEMGPITTPERRVAIIMGIMALLWSFRQWLVEFAPLTDLLPFIANLSDMHIAVGAGLVMFLVPSGSGEKGQALLTWESAVALPWGVILLFGGGLSLAAAIKATGLAIWAGEGMSGLATAHLYLIMLAIVGLVIFLTELTSNTATTAALVPVLARSPPPRTSTPSCSPRPPPWRPAVHSCCRSPQDQTPWCSPPATCTCLIWSARGYGSISSAPSR
nr:SLC13 family permease [Kordiimonas gwangyangensis]